jgi:predicted nuclease of predicted toxin-antitoxin system
MRLYLDDDLDGNALIGLLQHAGHEVVSPRAVGTRGVHDSAHLRYAADHDLVLLTANAKDFLALHEQWQQDEQEHPGMLLLYRENNPQRDMTFQEIARAVSRLGQAGIPLQNTYQNLNFWREPQQ